MKWFLIVPAVLYLLASLWYEGYKEGWRQATEASAAAPVERAYTPPASSPLLRL
jgi:hypothetical protein